MNWTNRIRPLHDHHHTTVRKLLQWVAVFVVVAIGEPVLVRAFPPAPYYTIYGDVRDAYGDLLPAGDASVIVYSNGTEVLREPLTDPDRADHNYQVRMRIDMMRGATASYSSIAFNPGSIYTIAIDVGGQLFYPLEIDSQTMVGDPAERRRFDLTLGEDSDGDGLPDAWEESQLYLAGYESGEDGWDLSLIDRDSDFDGDGLSNWISYTAGTYNNDHRDVLELTVKEIVGDFVRLEFYAIYGRIYSVETSLDLDTWTPVPFAYSDEERATATETIKRAETTGVTSIYANSGDPKVFFRLISR